MARDDDLLMRFHDGELDDEQARAFAERLKAAPDSAQRLEAMDRLGDALRARTRQAVEQQRFDDFFARVERGARAARPLSLRERVGYRLREWLKPWAVWPAAAAAGVALLALVAVGVTGTGNGGANDCTIESLEYSGSAGAVFLIPDDKGSGSTTVIWTTENNDDKDDAESR